MRIFPCAILTILVPGIALAATPPQPQTALNVILSSAGAPMDVLARTPTSWDGAQSRNRDGVDGTVEIWFAVNVHGRMENCEIMRSSGNDALDRYTCNRLKRDARFAPGRDARGRVARTTMRFEYTWRPGFICGTGLEGYE